MFAWVPVCLLEWWGDKDQLLLHVVHPGNTKLWWLTEQWLLLFVVFKTTHMR